MRVLNDEKIGEVLDLLWEKNETGLSSITYPDDPNILQGRAIAKSQFQQDIKDFIVWGDTYCSLQNKPRRECGHCWQSLKQLVEEQRRKEQVNG